MEGMGSEGEERERGREGEREREREGMGETVACEEERGGYAHAHATYERAGERERERKNTRAAGPAAGEAAARMGMEKGCEVRAPAAALLSFYFRTQPRRRLFLRRSASVHALHASSRTMPQIQRGCLEPFGRTRASFTGPSHARPSPARAPPTPRARLFSPSGRRPSLLLSLIPPPVECPPSPAPGARAPPRITTIDGLPLDVLGVILSMVDRVTASRPASATPPLACKALARAARRSSEAWEYVSWHLPAEASDAARAGSLAAALDRAAPSAPTFWACLEEGPPTMRGARRAAAGAFPEDTDDGARP